MSKKKIMWTSADEIAMVIQREHIPDTGTYDTVK